MLWRATLARCTLSDTGLRLEAPVRARAGPLPPPVTAAPVSPWSSVVYCDPLRPADLRRAALLRRAAALGDRVVSAGPAFPAEFARARDCDTDMRRGVVKRTASASISAVGSLLVRLFFRSEAERRREESAMLPAALSSAADLAARLATNDLWAAGGLAFFASGLAPMPGAAEKDTPLLAKAEGVTPSL